MCLQKKSGNGGTTRTSIPTLMSPKPLTQQYDGRTLKTIKGELKSKIIHGITVSEPFLSLE